MSSLPDLSHASAEPPLRDLAEALEMSAGQVFGVLRVAVTGQRVSPPLFETMEILGKDVVLPRVQNAAEILQAALD